MCIIVTHVDAFRVGRSERGFLIFRGSPGEFLVAQILSDSHRAFFQATNDGDATANNGDVLCKPARRTATSNATQPLTAHATFANRGPCVGAELHTGYADGLATEAQARRADEGPGLESCCHGLLGRAAGVAAALREHAV